MTLAMDTDDDANSPGDIFDRSAIHTTAAWVIMSELRRYPLRWTGTNKPVDEHTWYFVGSLVRQFMAYGYAVWRNSRGVLQTVDNAVLTRSTSFSKWRVESIPADGQGVASRGWRVHPFVRPPVWVTRPSYKDWPSPLRLSLPHLRIVEHIQENWLSRDSHNSRPAVFTHIDMQAHLGAGGGANGKAVHLPVYRSIHNSVHNQVGLNPGGRPNVTFQQMIDDRHDAIRKLSEKSTLEREAILGGSTPLDHTGAAAMSQPSSEMFHEEHVVSDGKAHSETKTLLSLPDGRFHYDRARHNVYFALGVPPQATGETVNSERTASNAATFDTAMSHFLMTVRLYRDAISAVLEEATMLEDGSHMAFGTGLSSIQLDRVMPYLKPKKATELLSQVYDLDQSYFDVARIAAAASTTTTGRGKGPQQQLNYVSATKTQSKQFSESS